MKKTITILALLAAAVCAQADDNKKTAAPAPQALTIPKDAVANSDGLSYTWTDKQGKKWIYAKTPFGITKSPAADQAQPSNSPGDLSSTKVIDKGDTVSFERPSPFGPMHWEKKKADLTDEERRMLDAKNAKTADAQNANTPQK